MVFGYMLTTGTDTKGRRLLHNKKQDVCYLLPKNREIFVTLWKYNEVNAISISVIIGYFLFHNVIATIALAVFVYIIVMFLMNKRFLPSLHKAQGKHITWRKEEKTQSVQGDFLVAGLFFIIGVGLFICFAMGETHNMLEHVTAIAGGVFATIMGIKQAYKKIRK